MITFGKKNAKLDKLAKKIGKRVYSFSILSGHTCPFAKDCRSSVIVENGKHKIVDGQHTQFRCFSASQEALYKLTYESRKRNGIILTLAALNPQTAADVILKSLPTKAEVVRIHVAGDFKTQAYFDAWILVAKAKPGIIFYAYTKALPFWVKRLGDIPSNLRLTASYGGYRDDLIAEYNLPAAKVVFSKYEARKLGLKIDTNDYHAYSGGYTFALLIHGVQPAKTKTAKALARIKWSKGNG